MTVVTLAQLEHSASMFFRIAEAEWFLLAVMMIANPSYCCFYSRLRTTADHFDIYGIWKKVILLFIRLLMFNFRWIFFSCDCSKLLPISHSTHSQFVMLNIAFYEVHLNVLNLNFVSIYLTCLHRLHILEVWKMLFDFCFSEISGFLWSLRYRLRSSQA